MIAVLKRLLRSGTVDPVDVIRSTLPEGTLYWAGDGVKPEPTRQFRRSHQRAEVKRRMAEQRATDRRRRDLARKERAELKPAPETDISPRINKLLAVAWIPFSRLVKEKNS